MDRWSIQEVYGMHNMPGMPVGEFAIRPGPLLAASDGIRIEITGKGGHAARPHECIDPVAGRLATSSPRCIRSSRATSTPSSRRVISICMFHAGEAFNVIPETAELQGTARTLDAEVRDLIERRMERGGRATARLHGARSRRPTSASIR